MSASEKTVREEWEQDIKEVFSTSIAETVMEMVRSKGFRARMAQEDESMADEYVWTLDVGSPEEYGGMKTEDFLLGSFKTRREAVDFCREMGWKITSKKRKGA